MNRFAKLVSVAAISSRILVSAQDIAADPTSSDVVPTPSEEVLEPTVVEEDASTDLVDEAEPAEKLETETLDEDGTDNATT